MWGKTANLRAKRSWIESAIVAGLAAVLVVSAISHQIFSGAGPLAVNAAYNLTSADSPDAISPVEITVVDGDTIKARGRTISLVGFDAPGTGRRAHCPHEREMGDRAAAKLKTLIAGGGLALRIVPCACNPGTEGTPDCNSGRACGDLRSYGRPIGGIMVQYVLARPYMCDALPCPPRKSWC